MELHNARTILLCLRYGIGDVVMETPLLDALRRAVPRARITVLGMQPAVELLRADPRVDEVLDASVWGLTHRWDEGDERSRATIHDWLDTTHYDLFLDVTHAIEAVRAAIHARGLPALDADQRAEAAAVADGEDGVAAIKAAVRSGWGLTVPEELLPRLDLLERERRFARRFLGRHATGARAPVGISPVASLPMKRWPTDRFASILDWVAEETGRPALLFTGPQHEAGEAVLRASRHGGSAVRVGTLHLRRTTALLAHCSAFLCNDTGLMHMAAAVGTPTIGVFGPTSPGVYLPPAAHAVAVGGRDIDCPHRNTGSLEPPGCWTSDHCLIAEHSCVRSAGVEAVRAALHRVIGQRAA